MEMDESGELEISASFIFEFTLIGAKGTFPFSRLEVQLFDLSRYFILHQWMVA